MQYDLNQAAALVLFTSPWELKSFFLLEIYKLSWCLLWGSFSLISHRVAVFHLVQIIIIISYYLVLLPWQIITSIYKGFFCHWYSLLKIFRECDRICFQTILLSAKIYETKLNQKEMLRNAPLPDKLGNGIEHASQILHFSGTHTIEPGNKNLGVGSKIGHQCCNTCLTSKVSTFLKDQGVLSFMCFLEREETSHILAYKTK